MLKGSEHAAAAHETIKQLVSGQEAETPLRKKTGRNIFTDEETDAVRMGAH